MAVEKTKQYTVEDFERIVALPENSDRLLELVDGEIVEKMPTEPHGLIQVDIATELRNHTKPRSLGRVTAEPRHQIPDDRYNSRLPDIAFTSKERALPLETKGAVQQMSDLVAEIQSPDDSLRKMRQNAAYYLANGTRLAWLVLPKKHLVEIYRANHEVDVLTENDSLDGEDVLPGFTLPVRDIFAE